MLKVDVKHQVGELLFCIVNSLQARGMLEISIYMLIYVFHISPKITRLCRIQINAKVPLQFMIGEKKVDQM